MNYQFPTIDHIGQVLEVIKPYNNFVVRCDTQRGFTTIDYTYCTQETFSRDLAGWEILRECRGIAFDNVTGKVVSRPFQKFFNYGEKPETTWKSIKDLKWSVAPKWDGSMIRPIPLGDSYVLATRAGVTAHAMEAAKYITKEIDEEIREALSEDITLIYEFIGPANINVLHYPKNTLKYLASRNNHTGLYYQDPNYKVVPTTLGSIEGVKYEKDIEGYVFITADGQHRMKVKTEEYVIMHRAKDKAATERAVLEVFFSGKWDDFFSMLPEGDRKVFLQTYIENIEAAIDRTWASLNFILSYSGENKLSKKEFALHIQNDAYTKAASPILFQLYEKPESNLYDLIMAYGLRNSSSNSGLEKMRWLIGYNNFKEEEVEDSDG